MHNCRPMNERRRGISIHLRVRVRELLLQRGRPCKGRGVICFRTLKLALPLCHITANTQHCMDTAVSAVSLKSDGVQSGQSTWSVYLSHEQDAHPFIHSKLQRSRAQYVGVISRTWFQQWLKIRCALPKSSSQRTSLMAACFCSCSMRISFSRSHRRSSASRYCSSVEATSFLVPSRVSCAQLEEP